MFVAHYVLHGLVVAAALVSSVDICGKPKTEPNIRPVRFPSLIVNGIKAVPHSWPWQVQLQTKVHPYTGGWTAVCGGTIVTRYHIITAASCFENENDHPENWRILVGAHNVSKFSSDRNFADVFRIDIQENYRSQRLGNDIAIVTLKDLIRFGDNATDVCLSGRDFYAGNKCFVTGWGGSDAYEHVSNSDVLLQSAVSIYPFTMCQREYSDRLDETMTCAYNKQRESGVCKGDRGSPLVCQNRDGAWVLQGISSFQNVGCGVKPAVFTRVPFFLQWINKIIKN